ncbi:hypothetical protein R83H12_02809 [Fibrobacteria bacterium R8-3-H12]
MAFPVKRTKTIIIATTAKEKNIPLVVAKAHFSVLCLVSPVFRIKSKIFRNKIGSTQGIKFKSKPPSIASKRYKKNEVSPLLPLLPLLLLLPNKLKFFFSLRKISNVFGGRHILEQA